MLHVRSLSSYLINFVYTSLSTVLLSNHPRSSLFKKKEKNTYTLRKTGINYANKQEKKRICDDVPKLNCAKGLGGGPNPIFIISTWHPRFPISIKGGAPPCRGFLSVFIIKFLGVESWPSRIPPLFKCFNIRIHVAFDCILMAPIYRPIPLITFIE